MANSMRGVLFCGLVMGLGMLYWAYKSQQRKILRSRSFVQWHLGRLALQACFRWSVVLYISSCLLVAQLPTLGAVRGPTLVQTSADLAGRLHVRVDPVRVTDLEQGWSDEVYSFWKLKTVTVSGPLLQLRLRGGGSLLAKAKGFAEGSPVVGVLTDPIDAGFNLLEKDGWVPYVLECEAYSFVPQLVFSVALVAMMGLCVQHVAMCVRHFKFPGSTPWVHALEVYSANPASVVRSINDEIESEDAASTDTLESALYITQCWVVNAGSSALQVAHFSDIATIQPLAVQHPEQDQFFGVQFVVRRGQQFSVRMTREQFERVERVMAAKHQVARQLHELEVQQDQLESLTQAVQAKREQGMVYQMQPTDDPDSFTCMTMCGSPVQVKVQRCCEEAQCHDRRECLCIPTLCLKCMSRWFQEAPTTTCPTCRVSFCMDDCLPVDLPTQRYN